jgi:lysophospholipase L1-like esterase
MGTGGSSSTDPGPVTPCTTNELSMCKMNATPTSVSFSIPYSVECHFGGDPGNYEVTVELGGSGAGDTQVQAERRRPMLPEIMTAAGATERYSFVVNVRTPEGEPIQNVPPGIAGLDVYFGGATPRLTSICHHPMAAPVVVYVAGDSTVCDQYTSGYAAWGQHLPQFFVSPISIANYADSGESSVSFIRSNSLWGAIKSRLKPGDWVLLEMGHNDKTTSKATFESNMSSMANDAKAAGAHPIFVTPISRATGGCAGQLVTAAMDIPQTLRDLGKSMNIPVIDLTTATCNWFGTVGGPAAAKAGYYANGTDGTHTGPKGAQIFAGFVRDAIKASIPDLAKYLRP